MTLRLRLNPAPLRVVVPVLVLGTLVGCQLSGSVDPAPRRHESPRAVQPHRRQAVPAAATAGLRGTAEVAGQASIGNMACGPCALYNGLLAGDARHIAAAHSLQGHDHTERISSLIEEYGESPSVIFGPKRPRYHPVHGTYSADLLALGNDFRWSHALPPATGIMLDRRSEETRDHHLRRVHSILSQSTSPPLVEMRSFVADQKPSGEALWDGINGHLMAVVSVDPIPSTGPVSGFQIHCADSYTGRVVPVFVAVERFRAYRSTKSFTLDKNGKEVWTWHSELSPYLVLTVPDLSLATSDADWNERTYVALTWVMVTKA